MEKQKFDIPELEIIVFETEDIITASGGEDRVEPDDGFDDGI